MSPRFVGFQWVSSVEWWFLSTQYYNRAPTCNGEKNCEESFQPHARLQRRASKLFSAPSIVAAAGFLNCHPDNESVAIWFGSPEGLAHWACCATCLSVLEVLLWRKFSAFPANARASSGHLLQQFLQKKQKLKIYVLFSETNHILAGGFNFLVLTPTSTGWKLPANCLYVLFPRKAEPDAKTTSWTVPGTNIEVVLLATAVPQSIWYTSAVFLFYKTSTTSSLS